MNVNIIRPVKWLGSATFRTVGYDADTFRMENTAHSGQRVPAHIHDHMTETFLIREGQATFWIGPERNEIHARAGDRVVAPVGTVHSFEITSKAPATLYVEFQPAADMAHMMAIIAGLQDDGEGAWLAKFLYLERRQDLRAFSRAVGALGAISNLLLPLLLAYGDLAGWKRLVGRYTPAAEAIPGT